MNRLSDTVRAFLRPLQAQTGVRPQIEYDLVKVEDPVRTADELVEALREGEATAAGANIARAIRRQQDDAVGIDNAGAWCLGGQPCCFDLARAIEAQMHLLQLPSRHRCPKCGTVWELRLKLRVDRGLAVR